MQSWSARPVPELPGRAPVPAVFDTRTQQVERLPQQQRASLYVCGITPYDATHMGHAATYVAFDVLNRAWLDAGIPVDYVQNVTDVDDPLLERAERDGVDWRELAEEQIELFRSDMTALNVQPPAHYTGATEAVGWIVPAVEDLLARGLAYRVPGRNDEEPDGDVYFDVDAVGALGEEGNATAEPQSEFAAPCGPDDGGTGACPGSWHLGQISNLSREEMLPVFAERGGDPDRPGKRNALDPLLWRVERPGEPAWDGASLGSGRPGWHIECSLISLRYLPAPFTVQGGGSDLVFPHHEMGAGHSWSISGHPMARSFMHTGMVGLDGEKMSKSRGNLVLVSRLRAEGVDPNAIRLAIMSQRYRTDWIWTQELLDESEHRLALWRQAADLATPGSFEQALERIRAAIAMDLDTPAALAAVDEWARNVIADAPGPGDDLARQAIDARLGITL
ncbi:cysteine--1-D-myo-inosityl 2-amino-2-deoxy-alpha-D-glucopyranoside ligase [Kocuria coralli]|uniref:L-cysteine:1D-myo-inositol 2-amino-2-deoxy-alpha-D-glucopyranoside ligase n=1 Tax=Kocuria coralli TaxID=1461025 RepID=A0A5J5KUF3_9MICC|nr:cysteine--1-D-myo-inosityl 2-amino-2-deoxy-alpha-D-glucopyranoside ligase [Kocuria coralli]KAA9393347.1 cysteine--1-D-myo-inosityl 2-amino-2-deoxy-alpha-D-glucopyranoside ligase [Kocuria coralli]